MGKRERNIYVIDVHSIKNNTCLISTNDELHLWHKRLGHINIKIISKLSKNELIRGIPKFTSKNIDLSEAYHEFTAFDKRVQNQKSTTIITIRSDHGGEFENEQFKTFCEENGITRNFAISRASPQNGAVERKNRTLQETARTMLIDNKL